MRSNDGREMTDTRRLSPQTISSSGYHSDLSSSNQSPQSIRENAIEQPTSSQTEKKTNKNLSRLSSFLRKQYERAKLKFLSSKQPSPPIKTCSKATSMTPLTYISENNHLKSQQPSSSVNKRSSFIEPVCPIYVHASYEKPLKIPLKDSQFNHRYSHQPSHRFSSYTNPNNNQVNSHSYRRSIALSNYENFSTGYFSNHPTKSAIKPRFSQNYYPYKYLQRNSDYNRLTYAPLSDFITTTNSAFKPIKSTRCHRTEQIPLSDDPCDLEVAQYFHQIPQWSNPNYFDIYTKQMSMILPRKNYTETLC